MRRKDLENTAVSAIAGTTLMTLFSYLTSLVEKDNFSEPEHLGTLIERLVPGISKNTAQIAGWSTHYSIGLLFVFIYQDLWKKGMLKKSFSNAFIIGSLSGILGAMVWSATLRKHPAPPNINFTEYLIQLIPAHIVFAICATITSRLMDNKTLSTCN